MYLTLVRCSISIDRYKIYSNWFAPHFLPLGYDYLNNGKTLHIESPKKNHSGLYVYVVENMTPSIIHGYFYLIINSN